MSRPNKALPTAPRTAAPSPPSPRGVAPSPPPKRAPADGIAQPTAPEHSPRGVVPVSPGSGVAPTAAGTVTVSPRGRGLTRSASPRKFPDKPPPLPPRAPPSNAAVATGRTIRSPDKRDRRSTIAQKKVMPTLRPSRPMRGPLPTFPVESESSPKPIVASKNPAPEESGLKCPSCGAHTTEAFCGDCGHQMQASSAAPDLGLDGLLEDAKLKVCINCTEEGFDAFCASCGGKMVLIEDEADDLDDDLDLPPPTKSASAASIAGANDAMARLEAALLQGAAASSSPKNNDVVPKVSTSPPPSKAPTVAVAPTAAAAAAAAAAAVAVKQALPAMSLSPGPAFALPKTPKERVFVIDLGSDSVKYGWNVDAEPGRIRACVDGRANVNTGSYTVKGQVFPMDSSVSEMEEKLFSDSNIYLDDLAQKICKVGNYSHEGNAIFICTAVPNHYDCVCDWIYRWLEGEVTGKKPRMLFMGYTPLLALMGALNSPSPTGLVIDVGATSMSCVPVYYGCKLDHAIQTQMLGGRLLMEIVGSKAVVSARDDNALINAIKGGCYVARDFKQEMAANGFVPGNPAMGQAWRGWKSTTTAGGGEKFVEIGPVRMGIERFCVPELFFNPAYHTQTANMTAVPTLVQAAVSYCPRPMQGLLLQNIFVHGEGARFPGFVERLQAELGQLFHGSAVRVTQCSPSAGWEGAKRFSCQDSFVSYCTNTQDVARYSKLSHRFF